jgi:uncharacterized membrane protein (UPF0136 family)
MAQTGPKGTTGSDQPRGSGDLGADLEMLRADIARLAEQIQEMRKHSYSAARRAANEGMEQLRVQGEAAYDSLRTGADELERQISEAVHLGRRCRPRIPVRASVPALGAPMLATLIGALVSGEVAAWLKRLRVAVALNVVAALFALTGLGFLVGAAYVAAARRFGMVEAAIGFGIAFILVAGILVGLRNWLAARNRHNQRPADLATMAGTAALTALPLMSKSRKAAGAVLVPLAGIGAFLLFRALRRRRDPPSD